MEALVCLVKPRFNPSLAGVWLDEANHGWRITLEAIRIASNNGWYWSGEDQRAVACWVGDNDYSCDTNNTTGWCSCAEAVDWIYRDAENWLNERCPDGYSFGFYEGSWYLQSAEWWETP